MSAVTGRIADWRFRSPCELVRRTAVQRAGRCSGLRARCGSSQRLLARPAAPLAALWAASDAPLGGCNVEIRRDFANELARHRPYARRKPADKRVVGKHADRPRNAAGAACISSTASRVKTCEPTPPATLMRPAT